MTVMDWNEHRPDSSLGSVTFDVTTLAEDGQQEGLLENVMLDAKPRGVVKFDATYYPVLKGKTPDEILPETSSSSSSFPALLFQSLTLFTNSFRSS